MEAAGPIAEAWPKWDSPWWRMSLLHELGLAPSPSRSSPR
jgi:hypothetical protein